jgi:hypothetical protein
MPWPAFQTTMAVSYTALQAVAGLASGKAFGDVKFHCVNGEVYKTFGQDPGAVILLLVLCMLGAIVMYTAFKPRFANVASGGATAGLSIQADDSASSFVAAAQRPAPALQAEQQAVYEDEQGNSAAPGGSLNTASAADSVPLLNVVAAPKDAAALLKEHLDAAAKLQTAIKKADKMTLAKAFDPTRNWNTLMEQAPTRTLGGLDGIRTISMFQIIMAHTCLLTLLVGQQSTGTYLNFIAKFSSQFAIGTDKAVDSFFMISGILLSYTTLGKLRSGRQSLAGIPVKTGIFTFLHSARD